MGVGERPIWSGSPVPYIIRWRGEERLTGSSLDHVRTERGWLTRFPDERPEDRDGRGLLWHRLGSSDPGAAPERFNSVHGIRQRTCMDEGRCQVCGGSALIPGGISWLLPLFELRRDGMTPGSGTMTTITPPTCPDCVPAARTHCPALRSRGSALLRVVQVIPWGVQGDLHHAPDPRPPVYDTLVPLSDPRIATTVASQLVVELRGVIKLDRLPGAGKEPPGDR